LVVMLSCRHTNKNGQPIGELHPKSWTLIQRLGCFS
jgi:hypothetical protein